MFHRVPKRVRPAFFEPLDPRRLFSVTVSEGYPGFYEIIGDSADDKIDVSVSMAGESFTLDGNTYNSVYYLSVNGGEGNDAIRVLSVDGSGMIGAGISGGDGNDSLALNFDGGIWGGAGDDVLSLSDSFYGAANGEEGNDAVYVSGACVSAWIQGSDGDDLIDCSGSALGVYVSGGLGSDTIIGSDYDDQIYGDEGEDVLCGGAGNDTFYCRDGEADHIIGGDGYDVAYVDGVEGTIMVEQTY